MDAKAVCLAAADLIEQEGWTQMRPKDHNGYCLVGAIDEVAGNDDAAYTEALHLVRNVIGYAQSPSQFNDTRTKAEVIAALRKAGA